MTVHGLLQEIRDVAALAAEYQRLQKTCDQYRGSVTQMVMKRAEVDACLQSLLMRIDELSSCASAVYTYRPSIGL